PQRDPITPKINAENGDANWVLVDGRRYYLPNGVADTGDVPFTSNPSRVLRKSAVVPGRWGEDDLVPGPAINPVTTEFNNQVRAGRTSLAYDPVTHRVAARDAADDDFDTFDPYPAATDRRGEVGDSDLYDESGALVLPIEWMRRFVTPVDIDGSGQVVRWNQWDNLLGPDRFGRVGFYNYFRPPGSPGIVSADGVIIPRAADS